MRKLLILLLVWSASCLAQDFEKDWKKVVALENSGLVKSADQAVAKIAAKAKRKNKPAQLVKCFFYRAKYLEQLDGQARAKTIAELRKLSQGSQEPERSIYNLVYARCLKTYQDRNYSPINRIAISGDSIPEDVLSWSNKDFEKEIARSVAASLENQELLANTKLSRYDAIFDYVLAEKFERMSLLDWVISENIDLAETSLLPNNFAASKMFAMLTGDAAKFASADFSSVSDAKQRQMLQLLQMREKNLPDIANNIDRLSRIFGHSDEYRNALHRLRKKAVDPIDINNLRYALAESYSQSATKANPERQKTALSFLDSIISTNVRSNAYKKAAKLKDQILSRHLSAEMLRVRYPGENARALVSFKNVDSIWVKCYKVRAGSQFAQGEDKSQKLLRIDGLSPVASQAYKLPKPGDHFEHSTEILLPDLPTGTYAVSVSADHSGTPDGLGDVEIVLVSNLAYICTNYEGAMEINVVTRDKGKPVANAEIFIAQGAIRKKTDREGKSIFPKKEGENQPMHGWVIFEGDSVSVSEYNYARHKNPERTQDRVQFYLDRAIYRPGQKVFYKGILLRKDSLDTNVLAKAQLSVALYNANRQKLASALVESNEFGSFSGEFTLPADGMTGTFSLKVEKNEIPAALQPVEWKDVIPLFGEISFKVEEYKRPRFEIVLDKTKEDVFLDREIAVTGTARSLSGSDISGAKVSYKVSLEYIDYAESAHDWIEEIVAQDSTLTDGKGKFALKFTPTRHEDEDGNLAVYSYSIEVEVTDINGETRSSSHQLKAGRHALGLSFVAGDLKKAKGNEIRLITENLNENFVPTKGKLEFFKLRKPEQKFKSRSFNTPEINGFSEAEFARLFPNERDERLLSVGADTLAVKTIPVNSGISKVATVDLSDLEPGIYRVRFSAIDKLGHEISHEQELVLADPNLKLDPSKLVTLEQLKEFPEKDGFAKFRISSVVPGLLVHVAAFDMKRMLFQKSIVLDKNEAVVNIPIPKSPGLRINVRADAFYDNYYGQDEQQIQLPIVKSYLEFETLSMKNLIEPGSPQTWSFRLKAQNAGREAEILASMYDSSLDALHKSEWAAPRFYNYSQPYWRNRNASANHSVHFLLQSDTKKFYGYQKPEFPVLMQFGFDMNPYRSRDSDRLYKEQLARKALGKNSKAISIYGRVTNGFLPVPKAIVRVKGSERSVLTDYDGFYEIEAETSEILQYSKAGFQTKEFRASEVSGKDIKLWGGTLENETITNTALGLRRGRTNFTVAETDKNDQSASKALAGKVSGLQINTENSNTGVVLRGNRSLSGNGEPIVVLDGEIITLAEFQAMNPADIVSMDVIKGAQGAALYGEQGANGVILVSSKNAIANLGNVKARTNLSETAFFFPHLTTDKNGKLTFSFTSPESLTKWKLRLFAHNKKGVTGQIKEMITTQKSLMLTPNFPRFFREKDSIVLSVKVSSLVAKTLSGNAMLELSDAATMQPLNIPASAKIRNFSLKPGGNATLEWKIAIPEGLPGLHYRVVAKSGDFSDGEENIIPVVSNRMLVTESRPLWIREGSSKQVVFEKLASNASETLKNHQLTLEFTSNPTWLALESLPYLMEFEHECAEQTFARFYANAIASSVIKSSPKVASVLEKWRENPSGKLEQNQELKTILANETPWFKDALSESEQKRRLGLLLDLDKMKASQSATLAKLRQKQRSSGGFGWFDGHPEDEFMTRHIASGIGHLRKLGISEEAFESIGNSAISFLDGAYLKKKINADKNSFQSNYADLHYLYARSFYLDTKPLEARLLKEIERELNQIISEQFELSLYQKAMAALVLKRFGKDKQAVALIDHLRETSVLDDSDGMHWASNKSGWHWYTAPIETQALLIEAFLEVSDDKKSVLAMKAWLIKNKQTSHWPSTKSTTEAVYALLLQGGNILELKPQVSFYLGNEKIKAEKLSESEQAETGYVKINWKAAEIKPQMASLKVENKGDIAGFGGFYWQYFEDLDKVASDGKGILNVSQELLRKVHSKDGIEFERIAPGEKLKVGELLTIRVSIRSSEDLEYVHLKSMRASCFEPVDAISGFERKNRLSFYKSTKDVATHYFFNRLGQGSYEVEYEVRVNNTGDFSNGITTIQSMYAPEFSAHSKGIRVKVK